MLEYLLYRIGPKWRHILMKKLNIYEAMHDEEWLKDYCC